MYYIDHNTGTSTWTDPRTMAGGGGGFGSHMSMPQEPPSSEVEQPIWFDDKDVRVRRFPHARVILTARLRHAARRSACAHDSRSPV